MKTITPSAVLRARALDALKATWPTVLAGSAVINLVSYVLNQAVGVIPVVGSFLTFLVTAVLTIPMMGLTKGVMGYFRGKPLTFDCIRSMLPHAWKIILLYLWTMLCLLVWMLPGMGGMVTGVMMAGIGQKLPVLGILGGLTGIAGVAAMIVLPLMAAFSYSMNNCILIDDPATPVRDVTKKSKAMMQGYRWHYVKVSLPVFIIIFVVIFIIGALTAALPGWLASLISSVMSVFSGMLSYYFTPVMYEELRRIGR